MVFKPAIHPKAGASHFTGAAPVRKFIRITGRDRHKVNDYVTQVSRLSNMRIFFNALKFRTEPVINMYLFENQLDCFDTMSGAQ